MTKTSRFVMARLGVQTISTGGPDLAIIKVGGHTMDHLVSMYVADRLLKDELAPSSVPVIRSTLRRWTAFVEKPPRDWTRDDVLRWLGNPDLRPNTRKSMLTKLRPFCHWLMDRGYLRADPTRSVRARAPEQGNPRDLEPAAVGKLIGVLPDQRATLIVVLMLQTALRCSDVARIDVRDIDVRRKNLHARAKGGRGGYTHWVPIPVEAWELLQRWLADTGWRSGPLIRSYQPPHAGMQGGSISKLVGGWMEDAGLKEFPYDGVSAHALRHTCGQHMLDNGAQPRDVQWMMGHKNLRTTEDNYMRREPPGLRAAAEGREYLAV
jgi:integrase